VTVPGDFARRYEVAFLQHYRGVAQEAIDCATALNRSGIECNWSDLRPADSGGFFLGERTLAYRSPGGGWSVVVWSEKAARLAYGEPPPVNRAVRVSVEGGPVLLELGS
jgi:hypothetical protein